jgi:MSHA pilin protein MshA
MKAKQQGFTLIELVVVIVILGIVGAVATARFQDLSQEARSATVQAIAGEIQSSSAINYAEGVLQNPIAFDVAVTAGACLGVAGNLLTGGVPTGWTVDNNLTCAGGRGSSDNTCVLRDNGSTVSATLSLICTN